jgi:hypothetical protein
MAIRAYCPPTETPARKYGKFFDKKSMRRPLKSGYLPGIVRIFVRYLLCSDPAPDCSGYRTAMIQIMKRMILLRFEMLSKDFTGF